MERKATAIILAAGAGKRMHAACNKPYLTLMDKPVLAHTLAAFAECAAIAHCIVVAQPEECAYCRRQIVEAYGFDKVMAVVPGGRERQDSVYQGLLALPEDCQWVVVHDGARPLVTADILERTLAAAAEDCGAAAGMPVKDTIKRVDDAGFVLETPPRASLWLVQTPQVFARRQLLAAHQSAQAAHWYGTDDASLVERGGGQVKMVAADYENIKITTPEDLLLAETILRARAHEEASSCE